MARRRRGARIPDSERASIVALAMGTAYHHKTIARFLKCPRSRVTYVLSQEGVSTRDIRNGETDEAKAHMRQVLARHRARRS